MYNFSDDINLELVELFTQHNKVVGYDVAGMDIADDVTQTLPKTLKFLRQNNVKFTVHSIVASFLVLIISKLVF